jgi:hypothetical protein
MVEGVLLYGGTFAILGSALAYVLDRTDHETIKFSWAPQPAPDLVTGVVLPTIAIALLMGLVGGVAMWWLMEWLYGRHVRRQKGRPA